MPRVDDFPAVPQSAAAARRAVAAEVDDPETARVVALLVSELITTTLTEADLGPDDTITVHTDPVDHGLRVTVCTSGDDVPAPGPRRATEVHRHGTPPSGLGLKIIARMARRWGMASSYPGTQAWFEVDTP